MTAVLPVVHATPPPTLRLVDPVEEATFLGLPGLGEPQDWTILALCAQVDPELFFPEKGGSTRDAKAVCAQCEVRDECLASALEHDERFGIWGGLSDRERRRLKRRSQ